MHPHTTHLVVPHLLDDRRRQAPRRTSNGRLARRAGRTFIAIGTALAATGRRLQGTTSADAAPCPA